jgi:hypothetical protein
VADEEPTIAMLRPKYEEFRTKILDSLLVSLGVARISYAHQP